MAEHDHHDDDNSGREPADAPETDREFVRETPTRQPEPDPAPQNAEDLGGFRAANPPAQHQQASPQPPAQAQPRPPYQPSPQPQPRDPREGEWYWWTDGETSRPASHVPPRPDVHRGGPAWGATPGEPWSPTPRAWAAVPAREPRRGRAGAIVAAVVASAVLIASGVGIGWGLSQPNNGGGAAAFNPPVTGPVIGGGSNPNDNGNGTNGGAVNGGSNNGAGGGSDDGTNGSGSGSTDTQQVAQQVLPALVVIRTQLGTGAPNSGVLGEAAGTGMILTSDGEILTNNHVIRGATQIQVTTQNGTNYDATVVGADPVDDVALLQLDGASGLPTITTDTDNLTRGQSVVAIGNAYGTGTPSATGGSITDLNQSITAGDPGSPSERLHGVIQTNAPIAPGDSGGALVDTQGEVLGMITAATQTSAFSKTSTEGYAITINNALGIVNRIQAGDDKGGDIVFGRPGLLGVQVRALSAAAAARLGLSAGAGAYVIQVVPGTPAASAGMRNGSVITSVNGQSIGSPADLSNVMHTTKPGDSASISWVDSSGQHSASVQLITAPAV
jgi:S1-C subfamily serine protease